MTKALDDHKDQEPAEGSRDTIDRELARQNQKGPDAKRPETGDPGVPKPDCPPN